MDLWQLFQKIYPQPLSGQEPPLPPVEQAQLAAESMKLSSSQSPRIASSSAQPSQCSNLVFSFALAHFPPVLCTAKYLTKIGCSGSFSYFCPRLS